LSALCASTMSGCVKASQVKVPSLSSSHRWISSMNSDRPPDTSRVYYLDLGLGLARLTQAYQRIVGNSRCIPLQQQSLTMPHINAHQIRNLPPKSVALPTYAAVSLRSCVRAQLADLWLFPPGFVQICSGLSPKLSDTVDRGPRDILSCRKYAEPSSSCLRYIPIQF
jgi:hypothetical protein